ncbi:unnamed protein product, partial [Notodromas monacha]
MADMDCIIGKWKMVSSENFDDYMKALGVGIVLRNLANVATPTIEFSKGDDDTWTMTTSATFRTVEIKFKLNEEFEEVTGDGRKCATTFSFENGVLTQKQVGKDGSKNSELIRTFKGDDLTTVI